MTGSMRRRATAVVAVSAVLGLVVSGCGTGQRAQTAEMVARTPGVNVDSADGTILVRNAALRFPGPDGYAAGDTATVELSIFNDGTEPIRLVTLESELASSVELQDGTSGATPTEPALTEPAPTGPSSTEPDLEIPPGGFVHIAVLLIGLTEPVNATGSVPLTLAFSAAAGGGEQRMELSLPMAPPPGAQPRSPMPLGEEH